MDARPFNVLHNAGDQEVLAVADGVHFHLGAHHVFVNEDGVFNVVGGDNLHVFLHVLVRMGNNHVLAAQYIGGPQQDGIGQLVGGFDSFFRGKDGMALGTGDFAAFQQLVKAFPVLGLVNGVGGGAQNADPQLV